MACLFFARLPLGLARLGLWQDCRFDWPPGSLAGSPLGLARLGLWRDRRKKSSCVF